MPLSGGDIDERATGYHVDGVGQLTVDVIKVFLEMSTDAHNRLGCVPMPMDGQNRPRFDGIQHPLGLVIRGIPEVQVHPETRRFLGLGSQVIKGMLVNNHLPGLFLNCVLNTLHNVPYILILHIRTGREAEAHLEEIFLEAVRIYRSASIHGLFVHGFP